MILMRTESDTYNEVEYVRVLLFDCSSMNLANKLWLIFANSFVLQHQMPLKKYVTLTSHGEDTK